MKRLLPILLGFMLLPGSAFALDAPSVGAVPSKVDADTLTLIITTEPGAKVSVVGGPSQIAPVEDGVDDDSADGVVQVEVGLVQESVNTFSVVTEKEGESTPAVILTIQETSEVSSSGTTTDSDPGPGDHTPPEAPVLEPAPETPVTHSPYTVLGSVEANAKIFVNDPESNLITTVQANNSGVFTVDLELEPNKTNRFNFTPQDAAGNVGDTTQIAIPVGDLPDPEADAEEELSHDEIDLEALRRLYPNQDEAFIQAQRINLPFKDTTNHWGEAFIKDVYFKGVINGKTKETFAPNAFITRAELTKIVVEAFLPDEAVTPENAPFPDVEVTDWFAPYVMAAKKNVIVNGYKDGTFHPHQYVNRAEALKIILSASGLDFGGYLPSFADVKSTDWFAIYTAYAQAHDIVTGYADGYFRPENQITRAEVVKIVSRVIDLVDETENE